MFSITSVCTNMSAIWHQKFFQKEFFKKLANKIFPFYFTEHFLDNTDDDVHRGNHHFYHNKLDVQLFNNIKPLLLIQTFTSNSFLNFRLHYFYHESFLIALMSVT